MLLSVFLETLLMGRLGRWVEFVLKDLADGFTSDAGIYYREILQWHFVEWNSIDRLEYWPRRNHRITMLRGNRPLPIQFGASPQLASIQIDQHASGGSSANRHPGRSTVSLFQVIVRRPIPKASAETVRARLS